MSSTPSTASTVAPEKVTGFQRIREARHEIRAQGAMTAVRQLLLHQLQERRAMAEALTLDVKFTPDAGQAIKLLELKEIPAAPLPADERFTALEARLMQMEAAILEIDDKAGAIFEARLAARVDDLERSYDAMSEGAGGVPDEDAHERAAVEAEIEAGVDRIGDVEIAAPRALAVDLDRRTLSTGEAA